MLTDYERVMPSLEIDFVQPVFRPVWPARTRSTACPCALSQSIANALAVSSYWRYGNGCGTISS